MIILNPKAFVNLFESNELNTETNFDTFLEGWGHVAQLVIEIFRIMPINATFVYENASFHVQLDFGGEQMKKLLHVNSVEYVIIKIFHFLQKSS